MKRIILIAVQILVPTLVFAQTGKVSYDILDQGATYFPPGKKTFYVGDSISVQPISQFDLQQIVRGKHLKSEIVHIEYFSGTYEISALFAAAVRIREEKAKAKPIYGKRTSGGISHLPGDKSNDEYSTLVLSALKYSYNNINSVSKDNRVLRMTVVDNHINVKNEGDNPLYIDIIFMNGSQCNSVVSYDAGYFSERPLAAGESREIQVDDYTIDKDLYLVGTSIPIAYNTIDLNDYNDDQEPNFGIYLEIDKIN